MPSLNQAETGSVQVLVITRREGEQIKLGDDITITVKKIRKKQFALAIEAPRETPVHREEVYLRSKEELQKQ